MTERASQSLYLKENEEIKMKWEITIDAMMIIGKYFESNNHFIDYFLKCRILIMSNS